MIKNKIIRIFSLLLLCSGSLVGQITKSPIPYVESLVVCERGDWNFRMGEEAVVELLAYAGGVPLDRVEVSFEAGNEMMSSDMKRSLLMIDGRTEIRFGTMNQPGFRSCKMSFEVEGKIYTERIKVGFSPNEIQPTVQLPGDFRRFWQAELAASQIPVSVETTYKEKLSTETVDVYLVKLRCDEAGRYIYGYLSQPKGEGKHPVLLVPPGAGVRPITPVTDYAEEGFITLAIEVHGLSPEADEETRAAVVDSIGDYIYSGLDHPRDYYYKKVYLSCVRAVDYLCSLSRFDGVNVGTCGGSQGGALALVTAALDERVRFVSSFYPALSDMPGFLYHRAGGWPKFFEPGKSAQLSVSQDTAVRTLAYYDVVNFARMIKVPGFYSYGYNDNTCSPTSVASVINSISAPKTVVVTPTSAHWRFPETNWKSTEWMRGQITVNSEQ